MGKIKIAILGFGKVGQTIYKTVKSYTNFSNKFEIIALWNRTSSVFDTFKFEDNIIIYEALDQLIDNLADIDLVVECAHASILKNTALKILKHCNLLVSSPSALSDSELRSSIKSFKTQNKCLIPLGASVGVWDVIKLDQDEQIDTLQISMKKHPHSFKIQDEAFKQKLNEALITQKETIILDSDITAINKIAPQNTNTMSIYALCTGLGFENCRGTIIANTQLESHIVELNVMTKSGLLLSFIRDNPAYPKAVTGKATFNSFLNSLYNFDRGVAHRDYVFC